MSYRRNSNDFTYIFDHARTNGYTADTVRRRPTTEIQNGGHQTGSTLYLRNGMTYRRNSNGFTQFSTMPELKVTPPTLPDVGRTAQLKIFKMADCRPEVDCISGMELHIAEIPTALPAFSTMPEPMVAMPTLCDVGRLAQLKMADTKPEVLYITRME
jgi:hypothetical protein